MRWRRSGIVISRTFENLEQGHLGMHPVESDKEEESAIPDENRREYKARGVE